MNDFFESCYAKLNDLEGNALTNLVDDQGGLTKYGISHLAYPGEDIANLTIERAKFLTHRDYWQAQRLDELRHPLICFQLLESSFHMDPPGWPFRSVLIAQLSLCALGVDVALDGKIGPQTIAALNAYRFQGTLYNCMNIVQAAFLLVGQGGTDDLVELVKKRLPQLKVFFRGWLRRIDMLPDGMV